MSDTPSLSRAALADELDKVRINGLHPLFTDEQLELMAAALRSPSPYSGADGDGERILTARNQAFALIISFFRYGISKGYHNEAIDQALQSASKLPPGPPLRPQDMKALFPASSDADRDVDWPPKFEMMKLQARAPDGGDWIDIYPAQLEWMAKDGSSVRALEATLPRDAEEADFKLTYIKRWRTIVKLPAKYADEIRDALSLPRDAARAICATPPEDLLDLADAIEEARNSYLDAIGRGPGGEVEKRTLQKTLWNDKGTFAPALRLAASKATPRDAERETIERCAQFIESGAGMANLIDQDELDQQAKLLRALPSVPPREGALQSTTEQADASLDHPVREACAAICDAHAAWAESKIEEGDDPTSSTSQMWACMSNTANDLAEMIRKDLPPMKSAPQLRTSHNSGELQPNGDAAGCGADTTPREGVEREAVAKAIQQFWQGPSGRPWDGSENSCCEKLPPQAEWFRKLADAILAALPSIPPREGVDK